MTLAEFEQLFPAVEVGEIQPNINLDIDRSSVPNPVDHPIKNTEVEFAQDDSQTLPGVAVAIAPENKDTRKPLSIKGIFNISQDTMRLLLASFTLNQNLPLTKG